MRSKGRSIYVVFCSGADDYTKSWRFALDPYLKSSQIFKCPSNPDKATSEDGLPRSYGANGGLNQPFCNFGDCPFRYGVAYKIGSFQYPSQLIAIVDAGNTSYPNTSVQNEVVPWGMYAGHLGTMNCLFFDGHVKAYKPERTVSPIMMWTTSQCNSAPDPGQLGLIWGGPGS